MSARVAGRAGSLGRADAGRAAAPASRQVAARASRTSTTARPRPPLNRGNVLGPRPRRGPAARHAGLEGEPRARCAACSAASWSGVCGEDGDTEWRAPRGLPAVRLRATACSRARGQAARRPGARASPGTRPAAWSRPRTRSTPASSRRARWAVRGDWHPRGVGGRSSLVAARTGSGHRRPAVRERPVARGAPPPCARASWCATRTWPSCSPAGRDQRTLVGLDVGDAASAACPRTRRPPPTAARSCRPRATASASGALAAGALCARGEQTSVDRSSTSGTARATTTRRRAAATCRALERACTPDARPYRGVPGGAVPYAGGLGLRPPLPARGRGRAADDGGRWTAALRAVVGLDRRRRRAHARPRLCAARRPHAPPRRGAALGPRRQRVPARPPARRRAGARAGSCSDGIGEASRTSPRSTSWGGPACRRCAACRSASSRESSWRWRARPARASRPS